MEQKVINSKVSIIDQSGVAHVMGRVNEPRLHVKYLLDYIDLNYPNINTNNLTVGNARERFAYQLALLGNITYFNDINFGMFYFPNDLTDEQLETLYSLDLGNKKVGICYNLKEVGKNIMSRPIGMSGDYTLKDAMEEYMGRQMNKHCRR